MPMPFNVPSTTQYPVLIITYWYKSPLHNPQQQARASRSDFAARCAAARTWVQKHSGLVALLVLTGALLPLAWRFCEVLRGLHDARSVASAVLLYELFEFRVLNKGLAKALRPRCAVPPSPPDGSRPRSGAGHLDFPSRSKST